MATYAELTTQMRARIKTNYSELQQLKRQGDNFLKNMLSTVRTYERNKNNFPSDRTTNTGTLTDYLIEDDANSPTDQEHSRMIECLRFLVSVLNEGNDENGNPVVMGTDNTVPPDLDALRTWWDDFPGATSSD